MTVSFSSTIGWSRGREAALAVPAEDICAYNDLPDAWIEDAVASAVDTGYSGPDEQGADEYVTAFATAAAETIRNRMNEAS